jgi:BarA-like signal transduction histidine kinase
MKISITFFLVPYSDSVYKTPKTHFDLLLLKTAIRAEKLLSNGNNKEKRE